MMRPKSLLLLHTVTGIFAFVMAASSSSGEAFAAASPWVAGHKSKARLMAGRTPPADGDKLLAFVEIALEPGWKTYWRTPGDAGGLPPSFDWSKSSNLASADVMFPAPQRFTDKSGNTIGYRDGLVLPVAFTAKAPGEPVSLVVGLQYGICKEVCVPVETELMLDVLPDEMALAPSGALQALDDVPRPQAGAKTGDPVLLRAESVLDGASPKISIEARFPADAARTDVFLEAPDGLFLPIPERVGEGKDGALVFEAGLGADVDLARLAGKTVTVTLVGETGASVATFVAK